jgi:hypothetical protein
LDKEGSMKTETVIKRIAIAIALSVVGVWMLVYLSAAPERNVAPVAVPVAATETPKPAVVVPQESEETKRYRKLCANEKYLAERRPLAEWTQQDVEVIRYCKQKGLY